MASGSSFAALSSKARKGNVATTATQGGPSSGGLPIGAFDDSDESAGEVHSPGVAGGHRRPELTVPTRKLSFADLAAQAKREAIDDAAPSYTTKQEASPFSGLVKTEDRAAARQARNDLHSIRVLTRLVLSVVNRPGSSAAVTVKSDALRDLVREVHAGVDELLQQSEASGWARAQVIEGIAEIAANRWDRYDYNEVPSCVDVARELRKLLQQAGEDPAIAAVFDDLQHSGYVRADSETVARERVEVSTRLAAWDLYEAVVNPRLGSEGYRYTYDREPAQIVQMLLPGVVRIARECLPTIEDPDMRISYLQASIRRVALLAGAEYVARTREVMTWISKGGADEEDQRLAVANSELSTKVVPSVLEWARKNFQAIEVAAPKLLEARKDHEEYAQRQAG